MTRAQLLNVDFVITQLLRKLVLECFTESGAHTHMNKQQTRIPQQTENTQYVVIAWQSKGRESEQGEREEEESVAQPHTHLHPYKDTRTERMRERARERERERERESISFVRSFV